MTYLNLIPAIVVIAAYFLGRWVGRRNRDIQLIELRGQNQALKAMLDFAQSESEHVAGLLKKDVSQAHERIMGAGIDPGNVCLHGVSMADHCGKCVPSEWPVLQARLAKQLKWCEGHRQYDLCHLP